MRHRDAKCHQAGLELDMLREQVSVHKSEFAELEASTTRRTSELQLLLEGERDKVDPVESAHEKSTQTKVPRRKNLPPPTPAAIRSHRLRPYATERK